MALGLVEKEERIQTGAFYLGIPRITVIKFLALVLQAAPQINVLREQAAQIDTGTPEIEERV